MKIFCILWWGWVCWVWYFLNLLNIPELFVILLTFVGFASFLNGITESVNMVIRRRKQEKIDYLKNSFKK